MTIENKREILANVEQITLEQFREALLNPDHPLFPCENHFYPSEYYYDHNISLFLSDSGNNSSNRLAIINVFYRHESVFREYDNEGDFEVMMMHRVNMRFLNSEEKRKLAEEKNNFAKWKKEFGRGSLVSNSTSTIYQSFFDNCLCEINTIPLITNFSGPLCDFVLQAQDFDKGYDSASENFVFRRRDGTAFDPDEGSDTDDPG